MVDARSETEQHGTPRAAALTLDGRVAVVTGGGRGIGEAIAAELAARGARVAVWDLDGERADTVAGALTAPSRDAGAGADTGADAHAGRRCVGITADVTSAASVAAAVTCTVTELGPIDIVVNNAGIDVIAPFLDTDESDWDRIIAVNLKGLFNTCKAVLPGMVERQAGTIINMGSDAGRVGSSGEAVYSATKGGVIAFTKTLAREHARHNITVNCVCPGPTDTALLDQVAAASQKLYDGLARAIPLRRIGQPADVARVVAFLAGDDAAYMTGQTLSVSGGLTMS